MTADTTEAPARKSTPGAYFGIPLPICVMVCLAGGLAVGVLIPENRLANAIYASGTYFPKTVVTFATLIVFAILSGATAKLVLFHRQAAGRLFGLILLAYMVLGFASLVYVTIWIPILTKLPLTAPGVAVPGFGQWLQQVGQSFSTLFSDQPLIQVLISAVVIGYLAAIVPGLRSVARGLIMGGQYTLWLFKKLLWYYPVMIGCLAIGIPLKFGLNGMTAYGRTTIWVGLVTVSWSVILATIVKLTTKRSLKQVALYYASVWPAGFGTGGSYETLAMNMVSAESDLGLSRDIAEVSIAFGTVMNKSCATMSVMLVTISVARLLNFPISLAEILTLIPPDLQVVVQADETQLAQLQVGQSANLSVESFPKEAFSGTVKGIAPVLDPRTRSVAVQVDVGDPQGKLKPGMFAQLAIQVGQRASTLMVPREAVLRVPSVDPAAPVQSVIYTVTESRVHKQVVSLGASDGKNIEIVQGVQEGIDLVLNPRPDFLEGELISAT